MLLLINSPVFVISLECLLLRSSEREAGREGGGGARGEEGRGGPGGGGWGGRVLAESETRLENVQPVGQLVSAVREEDAETDDKAAA